MKFLIFLFLIQACGKNTPHKIHEVSTEEAARDTDLDGVGDWRERSARENRNVALYAKESGPMTDRVILNSISKAEDLTFEVRRRIRRSLLAKIFSPTSPISLQGGVILDFSANPLFWRQFHMADSVGRMRLQSTEKWANYPKATWSQTQLGYLSEEIPVPENFTRTGQMHFPSIISDDQTRALMQKHYRLIISTEGSEHIYFISPTLPPQRFLQIYFDATFDGLGKLSAMAGIETEAAQPVDWESSHDRRAWWSLSDAASPESPQPGETVGFVHASLATALNEGSVPDFLDVTSMYEIASQEMTAPSSRQIKFVLHLPTATYRQSKAQTHVLRWEYYAGWEFGTESMSCSWTEYLDQGIAAHTFKTPEELLAFFQFNTLLGSRSLSQWADFEVLWVESSSHGTTAQVRFTLPPGQIGLSVDPNALSGKVTYGVTDSNCGGRAPRLSPSTNNFWEKLSASIYWGVR
jgi:hypothetical protein